MNFPLKVAFRYLYGKKSTNAINIITAISVLGIAIGTAALILILSVFNGFEGLMKSYLDSFNPDFKITSTEGKYFSLDDTLKSQLESVIEIESYSYVLEELALFEYNNKQQIGTIKGVDENYLQSTDLESAITDGDARFYDQKIGDLAILGRGVSDNLNLGINNVVHSLKIYVPNRKKKFPGDKDFRSRPFVSSGVFEIRNERDNQYVITNYEAVASMLALSGEISAIEIRKKPEVTDSQIKQALRNAGINNYKIADRFQQDESFLKITNIEKWTSYLIFSFVMVLIIFNLVGCLWMIVLDKRKDISILQSFGATKSMVSRIFLYEGVLICVIGFGGGLIAAIIFYYLQIHFGIIGVPEGYSITSYPMEMRSTDVIIIGVTVSILGLLASIPAAMRAVRVSAYVRSE